MSVPLVGPRDIIKNFINDLFLGVFDLVVDVFADILQDFIYLDPSYLRAVESVYQLGMVVFFGLVLVYGAATFGLFEVFPSTEKTDPHRFAVRAFAATTSLWIVNPPGWSSELTGQGAFAAVFAVVNELSALYLDAMGGSLTFQSEQIAGALGGPFLMLIFAYTMGGSMLLAELVLLALLVMRQVLVVIVYATYPLLIAFWIADYGPMKYGKQLAGKLFKTATTLMVGGILLSALFAVGMALISDSGAIFAGGAPTATGSSTAGAPVTDGVFASGGSSDFLLDFLVKAIIVLVVLGLPSLMLTQMLGVLGEAVSGIAQAGAAVATSGASLTASVASQGAKTAAKEVSKKGLRKGAKSTAKKGVEKAKAGAKGKAKDAARNVDRALGVGSGAGSGSGGGNGGGGSGGATGSSGGGLRERVPDLDPVPAVSGGGGEQPAEEEQESDDGPGRRGRGW